MNLKPGGAKGTIFRADLRVISRHTDAQVRPEAFDCAETTRQTVVLATSEAAGRVAQPPPLIKEVETICTYDLVGPNTIKAEQRTDTFLVGDAVYTGGAGDGVARLEHLAAVGFGAFMERAGRASRSSWRHAPSSCRPCVRRRPELR